MNLHKGTIAALLLLAPSAGAIELAIHPNWEDGDLLELGLSETGALSVYMGIGSDDGNVSFMNAFFDASPLNDERTAGYQVVGRKFKATRDDGSGWFRAIEWDGDPNIEEYAQIAADDDQEYPHEQWGSNGPWEGYIDSIIIHGTEVGEYLLYYENPWTVDPGHAARVPKLFDRYSNQKRYCGPLELPGCHHFSNAWRDDNVGFDVPFVIRVVPEPASLALLVTGAAIVTGRRPRTRGRRTRTLAREAAKHEPAPREVAEHGLSSARPLNT